MLNYIFKMFFIIFFQKNIFLVFCSPTQFEYIDLDSQFEHKFYEKEMRHDGDVYKTECSKPKAKPEGVLRLGGCYDDNRREVQNPSIWPSSVYGLVISEFKIKSDDKDKKDEYVTNYGTGTLINSNHVSTSSHNLYRHEATIIDKITNTSKIISIEAWAKRVIFIPGVNGNINREGTHNPFGSIEAVTLICPTRWIEKKDEDYDIGMFIIKDNMSEKIGFYGLYCAPNNILENYDIEVTGYPGEHFIGQEVRMYTGKGKISSLTSERIYYMITTTYGQSGSSVSIKLEENCLEENCIENYYSIGVHGYDQDTKTLGNRAVRLTKPHFDYYLECINGTYRPLSKEDKMKRDFRSYLKKSEENPNDSEAKFNLAECYWNGYGIKEDKDKACSLYINLCNNSNINILFKVNERLGDNFYNKNMFSEALTFYKKSKSVYSIYMKATLYEEKSKLYEEKSKLYKSRKKKDKAVFFYQIASGRGHLESERALVRISKDCHE